MGTNYYLMSKNKEFIEDKFGSNFSLTDSPYFGYEVHLCKISIGWKISFEAQKCYKSVKDMCNVFRENKDEFEIYDEYNTKFELEDFLKYIQERDKGIEPTKWIYQPNSMSDLTRDDNATEDYICTPFDHIEYDDFMRKHDSKYYWRQDDTYFNDDEGYNFSRRSFV